MLKEQEKHPPGPDRLHNVTDLPPTLEDQGITKIESHRWQQVATIDEDIFEKHLRDSRDRGKILELVGELSPFTLFRYRHSTL